MSEEQKVPKAQKTTEPKTEKKPTCGIIMPISAIEGCDANHWKDVYEILLDVCDIAGFEAKLVSNSEESHIIQNTIIQNVYQSDVVICDVSCKNANVMFELGMRLAFDKPAIIIKDDLTSYSFDTSPIEHLGYPRDLRFPIVREFKKTLASKLKVTYEKSQENNYSSFLKNFGSYKIAHLEEKTVSSEEFLAKELNSIHSKLNFLYNQSSKFTFFDPQISDSETQLLLKPNEHKLIFNDITTLIIRKGYQHFSDFSITDYVELSNTNSLIGKMPQSQFWDIAKTIFRSKPH